MIGSTFGITLGNGCSSSIWYIASKSAMANEINFPDRVCVLSKTVKNRGFAFRGQIHNLNILLYLCIVQLS